jgi:hypothetical protein
MAQVGTGYIRGASKQSSEPATTAGRTIKRNSAGNVQVVEMAHSTASGLDAAASGTRRLDDGSNHRVTQIVGGPPSAKAPQRAR